MEHNAIGRLSADSRIAGSTFALGESLLVTSLHVVEGSGNLAVQFFDADGIPDGNQISVDILHALPELDIALLAPKSESASFKAAISITPFPSVRGQPYRLIGFPATAGGGLTELKGVVGPRRSVKFRGHQIPAFQVNPTNVVVDPSGFSGAPLYLPYLGGIVAVFGGFYKDAGIHYAIPIVEVFRKLPQAIKTVPDIQFLPSLQATGVAKSYEASTFVPTLDRSDWDTALRQEKPSILLLRGPSGIGKSSHASAWAIEARSTKHAVLWADMTTFDRHIGGGARYSLIDYLYSTLTAHAPGEPSLPRKDVLHQLARAKTDIVTLCDAFSPHLVLVADGIEQLSDRHSFWRQLSEDLDSLLQQGIVATALCCERSEFEEAGCYRPEEAVSQELPVKTRTLVPLSIDDTLRVYEEGYRRKYSWLPDAKSLPLELFEIARIPFFMKHLVRVIKDLEIGKSGLAGVVLQQAIADAVETASQEAALRSHVDPLTLEGLRSAVLCAVEQVVSHAALSMPPKREVELSSLVPVVARVLQANHIDATTATPQGILTALSRTGTLNLVDGFASMTSDVLYEYITAGLYSDMATPAAYEDDQFASQLNDIVPAIHNQSLDVITPEELNDFVDRILSLPPCRETFALRFLGPAVAGKPSWPLVEFGVDLRLMQIVREYSNIEKAKDRERDYLLYGTLCNTHPLLYPEVALAFPVIPEPSESVSDSAQPLNPTEEHLAHFSDAKGWVRMRRALFALFTLSEHRLTVLQNIASSITPSTIDSYTIRMTLLANAILTKHRVRALQAYRCGQIADLTYLLSLVPFALGQVLEAAGDKSSTDDWPSWLRWVAERIVDDLPNHLEFKEDGFRAGPCFFLAGALRAEPKKTISALGAALKSQEPDLREKVLGLCDHLVSMNAAILPKHIADVVARSDNSPVVFAKYSQSLREELLAHARRPSIPEIERRHAADLATKFWDGATPSDSLPKEPDLRPHAIATSIQKSLELHDAQISELVDFFRQQFEREEDPAVAAVDSIVLCLVVMGFVPANWRIAWESVKHLVLRIEDVRVMAEIVRIVEREEEVQPGERYEAINLLLLPFDEEGAYTEEVRKYAICAEHLVKGKARSKREERDLELIGAARAFMRRRDFDSAVKCVDELLSRSPAPLIAARGQLLLSQARYHSGDKDGAIDTIADLERRNIIRQSQPDLLVELSALGKYRHKIETAHRHQVAAVMWPARELRAQILSEKGRTDAALEDLSTNRKEALALGAWWLAFRGLERECEIHLGKGNRDAAYEACQELENVEGKSIPQILGRMQRAVILVEEVESSDGKDSARETALPLLAQAIADVGKLEEILPRNEIEGIRMWLGSHHARCLRALEQFEEAIVVAEQVLKLATDVESKNDISGALALIQKCYECAGKPKDAFTSAEARFHFCKRHFPELREDAADSAAAAGRIISEMSSQPMARETRELAKHWLSQALSLYSDTGRTEAIESTQGQIAELEE